jgi:hypothetical protein
MLTPRFLNNISFPKNNLLCSEVAGVSGVASDAYTGIDEQGYVAGEQNKRDGLSDGAGSYR